MMTYIGFPISALIYLIIFMLLYYSKKRINYFENKIVIAMMWLNLVGLLLELGCYVVLVFCNVQDTLVGMFVLKSYILYIILFNWLLTGYIFVLTSKHDHYSVKMKKLFYKVLIIFSPMILVAAIITYAAPLYYSNEYPKFYTYGLATKLLLFDFMILMPIWLYKCIMNLSKKVNKRKNIRVAVVFLGILLTGLAGSITQFVDPSVLIITSLHTLVLTLVYFTIENPDLKMLREFQEAKDYAEKSNNEKTMFLYDLSQKVKIPVTRILRQSENIIKDSNDEIVNEEAGDIKYYSKKLLQVVDNVLDISNLERYDFKLVNSTYNIELLLKEIEIMARKSIIEKDVEFRSNISNSLPKLMYGDSIRLKQIINIVLDNAIKYTDKGFIELTVNSVIKHDVCRLIITVEDSGMGMSNEKVEEIFDKERMLDEKNLGKIDTEKANLAIASSLAKIIGGAILVSSEIGRGTNVTIVLDQKISEEYKTNMEKNAEEYYEQMTKEKVLVVGMELDKRTKQVLNKMDLVVEEVELGIDCLNRVRNGLKYKKIIMREKMDKLDGMTVYKKLQEVSDFNIPVIMVGEEENRQVLAKYKEEGISEYVNKVTKDNITELMK